MFNPITNVTDESQNRTYRVFINKKETDEQLYHAVDADQENLVNKIYPLLVYHNIINPDAKRANNLKDLEQILQNADFQVYHTYHSDTGHYNTNIYIYKCHC